MDYDKECHVLRFSYGKDSFKTLDVMATRGMRLDMITTTDVWATENVPAWLPPMDEFKARMDQWIWTKYRLEVKHLCARNKDGSKRTYEQMFYHVPVRKSGGEYKQGSIQGFPDLWNPWCQAGLKRNPSHTTAGNNYRIPSEHPIQLLPEAQNCHRQQSRDGRCQTGISRGVNSSRPEGRNSFLLSTG